MKFTANRGFDRDSVISTLARHEIAGLTETSPAERVHRRIVVVGGRPVELELRFEPDGVLVSTGESEHNPDSIERLVRHWFDLDADIGSIDRRLARHSLLAPGVRSSPGIRITRYPDQWEATVLIVLGQQVSLLAARTFGARLIAAYGEKSETRLLRFPGPARIAAEPVGRLRETLRVTGARARTIHEVATLFAEGSGADLPRLAALPGVGPWTVACVSIRGGVATDEFPASDAVLRRALGGVSAREAERLAREWRPYRSYAAVRLWADAVAGV